MIQRMTTARKQLLLLLLPLRCPQKKTRSPRRPLHRRILSALAPGEECVAAELLPVLQWFWMLCFQFRIFAVPAVVFKWQVRLVGQRGGEGLGDVIYLQVLVQTTISNFLHFKTSPLPLQIPCCPNNKLSFKSLNFFTIASDPLRQINCERSTARWRSLHQTQKSKLSRLQSLVAFDNRNKRDERPNVFEMHTNSFKLGEVCEERGQALGCRDEQCNLSCGDLGGIRIT
mmetsp:Transcript_2036/g.3695  ORF Transcript_2036/g.3695 Transcript_2036/m.3695 type:complete len:229 (-) Transcript_2036:3187-3873(-)